MKPEHNSIIKQKNDSSSNLVYIMFKHQFVWDTFGESIIHKTYDNDQSTIAHTIEETPMSESIFILISSVHPVMLVIKLKPHYDYIKPYHSAILKYVGFSNWDTFFFTMLLKTR